jgi:hypothetical protein
MRALHLVTLSFALFTASSVAQVAFGSCINFPGGACIAGCTVNGVANCCSGGILCGSNGVCMSDGLGDYLCECDGDCSASGIAAGQCSCVSRRVRDRKTRANHMNLDIGKLGIGSWERIFEATQQTKISDTIARRLRKKLGAHATVGSYARPTIRV